MRMSWLLASTVCMAVMATVEAVSLSVYPGELFLRPGRAGNYYASNSAEYPIAVVVEVSTWTMNEEGVEENTATDDIVVYPTHFVLKAQGKRKVRVSVRDRNGIDSEKTYRVTIRELPISFDQEEKPSGIYMAIAYRTACYIRPPKPKVTLTLSEAVLENGNLSLTIRNDGNVHQHLHNVVVSLQDESGKPVDVDAKAALTVMNKENVHAGKTRRFVIPLGDTIKTVQPKHVTLQFEQNKRTQTQEAPLVVR